MAEKTFKLKWPDGLGREWMNIDTLKLCLFSKEHTQGRFLTVEEVKKHKPGQTFHLGKHMPFPELIRRQPQEPKVSWWRRILGIGW